MLGMGPTYIWVLNLGCFQSRLTFALPYVWKYRVRTMYVHRSYRNVHLGFVIVVVNSNY